MKTSSIEQIHQGIAYTMIFSPEELHFSKEMPSDFLLSRPQVVAFCLHYYQNQWQIKHSRSTFLPLVYYSCNLPNKLILDLFELGFFCIYVYSTNYQWKQLRGQMRLDTYNCQAAENFTSLNFDSEVHSTSFSLSSTLQ